jgi:hypothetical protein
VVIFRIAATASNISSPTWVFDIQKAFQPHGVFGRQSGKCPPARVRDRSQKPLWNGNCFTNCVQIALTGGASGIGLETAKLLAIRGAILSIADVNQQGLDDVLKILAGYKNKHIATVVDVRNGSEVDAWIEKTVQQLGKIDSGVNIAGVARLDTPVAQETDDNWDFMMDVNSRGVFHCMRAQLKHMKDGGSIVSNLT